MSLARISSVRASDPHEVCNPRTCLGCPAAARDVLHALTAPSGAHACAFDSHTIEARQRVPGDWFGRYDLAIVRRGYLIRERIDVTGGRTAIDLVGPGCCFPILGRDAQPGAPGFSAYAVTRALVCTCAGEAVSEALEHGGRTAKELYMLEREAIARIERLADARARGPSPEKVAALLCAIADTLRPGHGDAHIPVELQQRDLAGLLSIRHESVCRSMRDFTKRGLIERAPDGLAIKDRHALERIRATTTRPRRTAALPSMQPEPRSIPRAQVKT